MHRGKRVLVIGAVAALGMLFGAVPAGMAFNVVGLNHTFCPVVINEVMVNPGTGSDDGEEFIELWNRGDYWVDISNWTVSDGEQTDTLHDYTGSHDLGQSGMEIPPGGFALIVESDYSGCYNDYIEDYAGLENFIMVRVDDDEIGNGLADAGDEITITTDWSNPLTFSTTDHWKLEYSWGSATEGVSIERDRYDSSTWMDSPDPEMGCTPCVVNSYN